MSIKRIKIRYILLILVLLYVLISIFRFIRFRIKISEKYGKVANKLQTTFYYNENMIINTMLSLGVAPIAFLHGGLKGVDFVFRDFKLGIEDFVKPLPAHMTLKAPFMDNKFSITMRGGEIVEDNFYEVLSRDNKFQHMYSEWVKKQVGIEDENVGLKFSRARCGAQAIGNDISIDFKNITSLANLNNEICENTHNYYICSNTYGDPGVEIIVNSIDSIEQLLKYADSIEKKIESRVFMHKHNTSREINQLFIDIFNKDGEKLLTICYDYDNKRKKFFKEENWIDYE